MLRTYGVESQHQKYDDDCHAVELVIMNEQCNAVEVSGTKHIDGKVTLHA
jgi:hypothetical protein